jgi:hypothetical protein
MRPALRAATNRATTIITGITTPAEDDDELCCTTSAGIIGSWIIGSTTGCEKPPANADDVATAKTLASRMDFFMLLSSELMAIPPVFGTIRAWSHYHDENGHAIYLLPKCGNYVAIDKIWRNYA